MGLLFIPFALHGIEAFLPKLSGLVDSLWPVLGLSLACWMVLRDVILRTVLYGSSFRMIRRYLACHPSEVGRVYRLLDMVTEGCPGHGPIHVLACSAAYIGTRICSVGLALGCLP